PYSTPAFVHILPTPRMRKECFNMATLTKLESRNELVKKEKNRLKRIFSNIDSNQMQVVSGLITQAARLRVLLDEMWEDITNGGDYEVVAKSEKIKAYDRDRAIAKSYNTGDEGKQKVDTVVVDLRPKVDRPEAPVYKEDAVLGLFRTE